jgi:hypothetical protein
MQADLHHHLLSHPCEVVAQIGVKSSESSNWAASQIVMNHNEELTQARSLACSSRSASKQITRHKKAQHGTAQHKNCAAQHSTAQHSTRIA